MNGCRKKAEAHKPEDDSGHVPPGQGKPVRAEAEGRDSSLPGVPARGGAEAVSEDREEARQDRADDGTRRHGAFDGVPGMGGLPGGHGPGEKERHAGEVAKRLPGSESIPDRRQPGAQEGAGAVCGVWDDPGLEVSHPGICDCRRNR